MRKTGFLTVSLIFFCLCAAAQSRQFLQERCKPILAEMGMDSTQFRVFTVPAGKKRSVFAQTNKPDIIIDTLAKKLYFRVVADSVKKYENIFVIKYVPNQTTPITLSYSMDNPIFKRP